MSSSHGVNTLDLSLTADNLVWNHRFCVVALRVTLFICKQLSISRTGSISLFKIHAVITLLALHLPRFNDRYHTTIRSWKLVTYLFVYMSANALVLACKTAQNMLSCCLNIVHFLLFIENIPLINYFPWTWVGLHDKINQLHTLKCNYFCCIMN